MVCLVLPTIPFSQAQEETPKAAVGLPLSVENVFIAGPKVRVSPLERLAPFVMRITAAYPHGNAGYRYDFEVEGREPGTYRISDYLEIADGSEIVEKPTTTVEIVASLPPGRHEPRGTAMPKVFRPLAYRTLVAIAVILWALGLLYLILAGRFKRREERIGKREPTMADRLRPFLERASDGKLNEDDRAELERLIIGVWRSRLGLGEMPVADALAAIRRDDEAGTLLREVESWLHRPGRQKDLNIPQLLRPYERMAADSVKEEMG